MFTLLFARYRAPFRRADPLKGPCSTCSAALSLALFGNYLSSAPSMGPVWISWVTKVGVVIISLIINIAGPQMIAYISAGLMVVMFVPFVAMCVQLGIEGKYGGALWTEVMWMWAVGCGDADGGGGLVHGVYAGLRHDPMGRAHLHAGVGPGQWEAVDGGDVSRGTGRL